MTSEQVKDKERAKGPDEGELLMYAEQLRSRGIKATSQRIGILRFLDGNGDHPDVDTIYAMLKHTNPSLSKTTVYNTLDLLREKGVVQLLTISGTEHRYEIFTQMHHHLLCNSCGRIYNIDISCPLLGDMLHGEHKIEEVHGYFRGICKHCLSSADIEI